MQLFWNAIVKNESARIERCVRSLLPYVDGAVIVDTGSSDGTAAIIQKMFMEAGKPIDVHFSQFENFAQARNEALRRARESKLPWDWLLLADADMELIHGAPSLREDLEKLQGVAYDMRQTVGSLSYYNRRLLSRQAIGWYECPTHEYLDVPTSGIVNGSYFLDHADGANRPDKSKRDVEILKEALKTETRIGLVQRMCFYLAQAYYDMGDWEHAATWYKKRVELGGWDEECWNAQLHYAHALGNMGKKPEFLWEMIQAYGMRPTRAEVLYDLARFFRERGQNHVSMLFSETGLGMPPSGDVLFVNDYVHTGCREEFGICAYYDSARRERGAVINDELSLDLKGTWQSREQARANLYWYLRPLGEHLASFRPARLLFPDYGGYVPTNPSVINHDGKPLILVRTVNYLITEEGRYAIRSPDGSDSGVDYPICSRNYLVALACDGIADRVIELALPSNLPPPAFHLVRTFEDSRLFEYQGNLWTISTVRELNSDGWCEQVLAAIEGDRYSDQWTKVLPKQRVNEKNWMPWVRDGELCFVYRLGTLVNTSGEIIAQYEPSVDCGHISGGSQVVPIAKDVNLAIVHEARPIPGTPRRFYQHRFVRLASDGRLLGWSRAFVFQDKQIEFAAGMALFGDKLLLSYGIRDREAWIAWVDLAEVLEFIEDGKSGVKR